MYRSISLAKDTFVYMNIRHHHRMLKNSLYFVYFVLDYTKELLLLRRYMYNIYSHIICIHSYVYNLLYNLSLSNDSCKIHSIVILIKFLQSTTHILIRSFDELSLE